MRIGLNALNAQIRKYNFINANRCLCAMREMKIFIIAFLACTALAAERTTLLSRVFRY